MACWGPRGDSLSILSLGPPRALGFSMESGSRRRLKVAQWTAGSRRGLSQLPRLHPGSRPSTAGVGQRGAGPRPGPSQGTERPFFAAQQSPCLHRARLQPPSRPADQEELVPAPTNMPGFCGEAIPGSLIEWVDLKAQSQDGAEPGPLFPLKHGGRQTHTQEPG